MLDLNKIMNDTLAKIEDEKFLEGVVEKHVKDALDSVIGELFKWRGPLKEQIKTEVESKLSLDISNVDLATHSHMMSQVVSKTLDNAVQTSVVQMAKKETEKLLQHCKDEYTLSELLKELKPSEDEVDVNSYDCVEKNISLHIDDRRSLTFIRLDEGEYVREYGCSYDLVLNKEGTIHSITIDNDKDFRKLKTGRYGLEGLLYKIYANKAKIILDEGTDAEDYDTQYLAMED